MSLRWRIAAALAAVAAAIGGLVAVGAYLSTADQLHSSIDESLSARAAALGSSQARGGDRGRGGPGRQPASADCPDPGAAASKHTNSTPRRCSAYAAESPVIPAPTTATSVAVVPMGTVYTAWP